MTETYDRLRLVGVAGSNKVMDGELSRLVRRAVPDVRLADARKEGLGAVSYPFDPRVAWTAVNYHRTSARVEWALYRSMAQRLEPLYDDLVAAVAADGRPWLEDGATLGVTAFNVREFAAGERQVVGTVKNALIDGARRRGVRLSLQPEGPALPFIVRLVPSGPGPSDEHAVVVSLDLAGRPMHQRGYRVETVAAPLREDVASVLLMLARYDARQEVLIDPMAGSGTLAIEATCMADARPLWQHDAPACRRFPPFRSLERAPSPLFEGTRAAVMAVERDEQAIRACRKNVERAGASDGVIVHPGDFRDLDPTAALTKLSERGQVPERGLILSNPPYGERLAPKELADLYRDLGRWVRRFPGYRAAFIVANPDFERAFGGRPRVRKPLSNGPLRGYFYLYDCG